MSDERAEEVANATIGLLAVVADAGVMGCEVEVARAVERAEQALIRYNASKRETITKVMRVTIEHGEDDLREWRGHGGEPVTIDRRAINVVQQLDGGSRIYLSTTQVWVRDSYAEVVAWWRGGR